MFEPQGHSPHISDATEADVREKVVEQSMKLPVLVDFRSARSPDSIELSKTLEAIAAEYDGRFALVRVDIDRSPQVAMMFRIQAIPTVYLVEQGQPIDGFQGGLSESQVRQFLARHIQPPERDPLEAAAAAMAEGQFEQAANHYRAVLADKPDNGEAKLGLARVALAAGDPGAAGSWLDRIDEGDPAWDAAQRLRGMLGFGAYAGDPTALQARVAADPKDVEAWYALGATRALNGDYEGAFAAFLEVVGRDREYLEDGGRKALLSLFDLIGAADDRVVKARRRLASLLF